VPPYSSVALTVRVSAYHAPFLLFLILPASPAAAQDGLLLSVGTNQQIPADVDASPDRSVPSSRPIALSTIHLASTGFDHSRRL
jgi:hypothetical protein